MPKELHVAIDFYDDILFSEHLYDEKQLRSLMAYCRSLGATTVQWIMDDMWALYESYPGGMDLLRTAIEAAHAQGMKVHVVYKPFEAKLDSTQLLPHTAPRPDGAVVWEDLRGLVTIVRPFVVAHPEMCLQRRPGDEDPGGAVQSIRLIKNEDSPSGLRAEDLSIWVSDVNGRFTRYSGSFSITESSEWRPIFPLGKTCRVVTLNGLEIPAEQRYIEVRLGDGALGGKPFCNDYDQIIELVAADGAVIPCTPGASNPPRQSFAHTLADPFMSQLVRYAHHPEARAFLEDKAALDEQAQEMRYYGQATVAREYSLHERRRIAVARGKLQYMCGVLNPVYPEVREHWLDAVRFCIERGADAVDFRPSHHGAMQENAAYGYNPPVLGALDGPPSFPGIQRVIGDAYTQFLREARDLLHSHNREMGVHIFSNFLNIGKPGDGYEHMECQWATWVGEIADFAVFRGAMGLREETLHYVIDLFGDACRAAKIPLIYQCNRRSFDHQLAPLRLDPDRLRWLEYEMKYALQHPAISAFQLYETGYFSHLDKDSQFQGSEEILELAQRSTSFEKSA